MTTSRREFLKAAGAAAAGAVVSPAVARAQAKKGVPKEPVKIGVIAIRAGIAAPVGMAGLRGTAWWADRVNKAGGILGREVQLVTEEDLVREVWERILGVAPIGPDDDFFDLGGSSLMAVQVI